LPLLELLPEPLPDEAELLPVDFDELLQPAATNSTIAAVATQNFLCLPCT
jgi:hypothetical protein